jgi:hypothetical protein
LSDIVAWFTERAPGRASHVPNVQVLDPDYIETAGKVRRDLLAPVLSGIATEGFQPSNAGHDAVAAIRSPSRSRQLALKIPQPTLATRRQSWYGQDRSCRQRCSDRDTPVYTHHLPITRRGNWIRDCSESEMPAARAVQSYPVGLRRRDSTRPAESYPAHLRHPYFADIAAQSANMFGLDGDDSEAFMTTGLPPRGLAMRPRDEAGHCLGEIPQRLLLNHLRSCSQPVMLGPCSRELPALLQIARWALSSGSPVRLLFTGQVPDVTRMRAVLPQRCFLGPRWEQAITGHANTLAKGSDNLRGDAGFVPEPIRSRLGSRNSETATFQGARRRI